MKKIIIFLLCGIFSFQLCGCMDQQKVDERREQRIKEIEATFEDDGVLQYCYDEVTDSYHVCGIVATLPTDFYFPTQFNGKIVSETSYIACHWDFNYNMGFAQYFPKYGKVRNLYLTDVVNHYQHVQVSAGAPLNCFLPENIVDWEYKRISRILSWDCNSKDPQGLFVIKQTFDIIADMWKSFNYQKIYVSDYKITIQKGDLIKFVQVANVVFYYNYENEQGKVFLVDNKDGAFLITKPPYEPIREGYKFKGWYKEPECINAWDFEKDLTPELSYNEQGELIFKETSLYAKWEKN